MPRTQEGPFSFFGRWVRSLRWLYRVKSLSALAQKAGVVDNLLTTNTKDGESPPSRSTIGRLSTAFESLAEDSPLRESLPMSQEMFYNIAGYASPTQEANARAVLPVLEYFAQLEERNQELEKEVARLQKENEQLRSRRRPRPSAALDGREGK